MHRPSSVMIVSSRRDPASSNIAQALITKNGFGQESDEGIETYSKGDIRLVVLEKLGIYSEPSDVPSDVYHHIRLETREFFRHTGVDRPCNRQPDKRSEVWGQPRGSLVRRPVNH